MGTARDFPMEGTQKSGYKTVFNGFTYISTVHHRAVGRYVETHCATLNKMLIFGINTISKSRTVSRYLAYYSEYFRRSFTGDKASGTRS
jgi:hypothetical protein